MIIFKDSIKVGEGDFAFNGLNFRYDSDIFSWAAPEQNKIIISDDEYSRMAHSGTELDILKYTNYMKEGNLATIHKLLSMYFLMEWVSYFFMSISIILALNNLFILGAISILLGLLTLLFRNKLKGESEFSRSTFHNAYEMTKVFFAMERGEDPFDSK